MKILHIASVPSAALLVAAVLVPSAHAQQACGEEMFCDAKVYRGTVGDSGTTELEYDLPAGQAYLVDLAAAGGSRGFDPYLKVIDADGGVIGEDDDSGDGLSARILLPRTSLGGTLRFVVSASEGSSAPGAGFELLLRPVSYDPTPVRALEDGARFTGTVRSGDPQLFTLAATRGQVWTLTLDTAEGSDLDPLLEIYRGEGVRGDSLVSDDDGGDGLNSLIRFVAPADGTYTVRAGGSLSDEGAYVLAAELNETVQQVSVDPTALEVGETTGTYAQAMSGDAEAFVEYFPGEAIVAGLAGEGDAARNLTVDLEVVEGEDGGGADPLLVLGYNTPLGFVEIRRDDDGGEGLNSRLTILAAAIEDKTALDKLRIRVMNLQGRAAPYKLTVKLEP